MAFDDGPTLLQILKGNNSGCGDFIRDQSGFAKQGRELHGKTGRVGGGHSSSGLVPIPLSKRVPNEYCDLASTPLSVVTLPFPSLRLPFHSAEALRFILTASGVCSPLDLKLHLFLMPLHQLFGASVFCRIPMDFHLYA
jgi:hypothetical protein